MLHNPQKPTPASQDSGVRPDMSGERLDTVQQAPNGLKGSGVKGVAVKDGAVSTHRMLAALADDRTSRGGVTSRLAGSFGDDTEATTQARPSKRLSGSGLGVRLMVGCCAAFLLAFVAAGALIVWDARAAKTATAEQRAAGTARAIAVALEPLVRMNDTTAARRLVVAMMGAETPEVSVQFPDGQIFAHSDPARITLGQLPETWKSNEKESDAATLSSAPGVMHETVEIAGRGMMRVTVKSASVTSLRADPTVVLGGLIGAGGIGVVVLIFRLSRKRLRTLGLVADALADVRRAGAAGANLRADLLRIDERCGPIAEEWNTLLDTVSTAPARVDGGVGGTEGRGSGHAPDGSTDLLLALNTLPTGLLIVDRSGIIRHANNVGGALAGAASGESVGRVLTDLFPEAEFVELVTAIRADKATRKTFEVRRTVETGESVLRVQCRPLRKEDTDAALITLDDVTQQRIADESRNLFITQATHEIRTPLTNMRLALETVMDQSASLPPETTPHLNMLSTEVRRLERLVSEMLAVSEIEAGSIRLTRSEVQLDRLLAEIDTDHRPHALEKKLTLTLSLPPKYPPFFGDRDKIAQALHNLVGNAVKYTPAGGAVTLTVSADGEFLSFAVTDTGFGISPEDQGKLFKRFARSSDPRVAKITGTGLGLALSREIARLHGGDITLKSEVDQGSTFALKLPLNRADRAAA